MPVLTRVFFWAHRCSVAELAAATAPGGWLRGRLLRLRGSGGRGSEMAARILSRVGAHPSDAACQVRVQNLT